MTDGEVVSTLFRGLFDFKVCEEKIDTQKVKQSEKKQEQNQGR